MPKFVTRFAPSPTGLLHLGHAYSALLAWDAARAEGGLLILRIEDIDQTRSRRDFEAAIHEDLAWLGLAWDEPARRQSDHMDDYAAALDRLIAKDVVYRCFMTRKEVLAEIARAPHGLVGDGPEGGVYFGPPEPMSADESEARAASGEAFAWRLSLRAARHYLGDDWERLSFCEDGGDGAPREVRARPERLGDIVIARKDAGTSYHLAATHDDALQGVTHVIRGEDLRESTHVHRLLQALLDLPAPRYRHHALILGHDGRRLAKRDDAATLRALREGGATPADIRARLGLSDCG